MSTKKPIAAIVDWYGPYYSQQEAAKCAKEDYEAGLYLIIGKKKYEHGESRLQYIGIADLLYGRLKGQHDKIPTVTRDQELWLGEIVSAWGSGRARLELVEWAYIYFLDIAQNLRKKRNPPPQEITIINRWWPKNFDSIRVKRPHRAWPDIIDYSIECEVATVGCLGGWVEKWNKENFE